MCVCVAHLGSWFPFVSPIDYLPIMPYGLLLLQQVVIVYWIEACSPLSSLSCLFGKQHDLQGYSACVILGINRSEPGLVG